MSRIWPIIWLLIAAVPFVVGFAVAVVWSLLLFIAAAFQEGWDRGRW